MIHTVKKKHRVYCEDCDFEEIRGRGQKYGSWDDYMNCPECGKKLRLKFKGNDRAMSQRYVKRKDIMERKKNRKKTMNPVQKKKYDEIVRDIKSMAKLNRQGRSNFQRYHAKAIADDEYVKEQLIRKVENNELNLSNIDEIETHYREDLDGTMKLYFEVGEPTTR